METDGVNELTSILAVTDFSDGATHAACRAARLAADHGAKLALLHVLSRPDLETLRDLFGSAADAELALVADARHQLDELAQQLKARTGIAATSRLVVGRVIDEIVAAGLAADMLVLGAHGASGLRELLFGTTAERLLRKTALPMLVVKRSSESAYRRVLVPVDFSAHSDIALALARRVAPSAEISVVHAFDVPFENRLRMAGVAERDIRVHRERAHQQALIRIDALFQRAGGPIHRGASVVERDDPRRLIVATEQAHDADLIIISRQGQSVVEEFLIGSVARRVIADATCDVLVDTGSLPALADTAGPGMAAAPRAGR